MGYQQMAGKKKKITSVTKTARENGWSLPILYQSYGNVKYFPHPADRDHYRDSRISGEEVNLFG